MRQVRHQYPLRRTCEWCDAVFFIPDRWHNLKKRFCNLSCFMHWRWVYQSSWDRIPKKRAHCRECKKKFQKDHRRKIWCCDKCRSRAAYRRRVGRERELINTCKYCRASFIETRAGQKFCSKKCCRNSAQRTYQAQPRVIEMVNRRRRNQNLLKKTQHKLAAERRREELAALFKEHRP